MAGRQRTSRQPRVDGESRRMGRVRDTQPVVHNERRVRDFHGPRIAQMGRHMDAVTEQGAVRRDSNIFGTYYGPTFDEIKVYSR